MKTKKFLHYAMLSGLALSINPSAFAQAQPEKRLLDKIEYRQSRLMQQKKQTALLSFNQHPNHRQKGTETQSRLKAIAFAEHDGGFFIPSDSTRFYWSGTRQYNLFPIMFLGEILPYEYYKDFLLKPMINLDVINTDSLGSYLWDNVKGQYVYDSKTISVLNDKGLVTSATNYTFDGTNWENEFKMTCTYDANSNLTGIEQEAWDGTVWEKDYKEIYRYDDNNNLITEIYLNWNNTGSKWDSTDKYIYDYDNANNWTSEIYQKWTATDWENRRRDIYTYSTSSVLESIIEQKWDAGSSAWKNDYKDEFTHTSSGQLTDIVSFDWVADEWKEWRKQTLTYSAGKQASSVYHIWSGSKWDYTDKVKYLYDNDLLAEVQFENWDDVSDKFFPQRRIKLSNNSFGQFETVFSEEWNGSAWESVKYDNKLSFYYEEYDDSGVGINNVKAIAFDIYPNPADDAIHMKTTGQKVEMVRIMDMNGKVVFESKSKLDAEEITIPVRNLANGTYVLQVQGKHNLNGNKLFVVNNR